MQILFYCIFQIIEDREPILKIFVKENITLELLLYKMLVIPRIDKNLLKHISPLNWSHINFLGEYSFQSNMALGMNEYRPLKV